MKSIIDQVRNVIYGHVRSNTIIGVYGIVWKSVRHRILVLLEWFFERLILSHELDTIWYGTM